MGQVLNSSSFFASSNLILIAAATGSLLHGEESYKSAATLVVIKMSSRELFEGQVGLIVLALARDCWLHAIHPPAELLSGRARRGGFQGPPDVGRYADAVARLLNPALSSFNARRPRLLLRGDRCRVAVWALGVHGRDRRGRRVAVLAASQRRQAWPMALVKRRGVTVEAINS